MKKREKKNVWYITFQKQHFSNPNIQWKWLFPSFSVSAAVAAHDDDDEILLENNNMELLCVARTVKWTVPQLVESLCSIIRLVRLYNWENEQRDCLHFFFSLSCPPVYCFCRVHTNLPFWFVLWTFSSRYFFCQKFIACLNCSQFFFFLFSSSLVNVES